MRKTLRRSCDACAKAKHRCDLLIPCSRCTERQLRCVYANLPAGENNGLVKTISNLGARSLDPFDTYPPVNLPRTRVQGLMHHFLSRIAFQYYPLDLDPNSNPFITSWWPLALGDSTLFHVSLQTASLDDELKAQKGFPHSDILMRDSVSLVRRKIEDPSLAFHDATINAVITLAAIEYGKGNLQVAKIHVAGVRRMVDVRGGLCDIKHTSPLTARMVPWVSMLVMGSPQFVLQDDLTLGGAVSSMLEPRPMSSPLDSDLLDLSEFDLDPAIEDTLTRLCTIFRDVKTSTNMSTTDLHDLACNTLHKLLASPHPDVNGPWSISNGIRYGIACYMFILNGPTYYSHAEILNKLVLHLKLHLESLISSAAFHDPMCVWLVSIGMVASTGTEQNEWFMIQSAALLGLLGLRTWQDVECRLKSVLYLENRCGLMFRRAWEQIMAPKPSLLGAIVCRELADVASIPH